MLTSPRETRRLWEWTRRDGVSIRHRLALYWATMALTALAGPVSNLLLALLLLLCSRLIYDFAPYSDLWNLLFGFLLDTAGLSIGLGVFNLVPIPPLDGSKVLAAFLPDHAYFQLMRYERYGMLLLIFLSFQGVGGGVISAVINWVWQLFVNLIY